MNWNNLDSRLALVRAGGADARHFLHTQLTCDINQLESGQGCLGAALTAQGKVVASFFLLPDESDFVILVPRSQADDLVTHLSRFIMRARVQLARDDALAVAGSLVGPPPPPGHSVDLSRLDPAGDRTWQLAGGRQLRLGPAVEPLIESEQWAVWDLRQGIVLVDGQLTNRFIPQMINLDRVGGVSFTKGCYPGQEIVARARNLGRVKRGLAWIDAAGPLVCGQKLLNGEGAACGEVIQVVAVGARWEGSAVVTLDGPNEALVGDQVVGVKRFADRSD